MMNRAIALCCCLLMSTVGFAQGGKIVKQTFSAVVKDAAAVQAQRGVLSQTGKTASVAVVKNTAAQSLSPSVRPIREVPVVSVAKVPAENKASSVSAKVTKEFSSPSLIDDKVFLDRIGQAMSFSQTKKTLNYATQLEQERAKARQIVATLKNYQTLNLDEIRENELMDRLNELVLNRSLLSFLNKSLENKNYTQFMRDLSNYYSLSVDFLSSYELRFIPPQDVREIFAQTALAYMKQHPHKMNLKLREIIKSPFVDETLKSFLRTFIAMDKIQPLHEGRFLIVLRQAHKQHTSGLANARDEEEIAGTVAAYQELLEDLTEFTSRYHRSPRWNAPMPERRLHNKLLMLIAYNKANQFKQVLPYIAQIKTLLTQYPSIGLTVDEILKQVETFIKVNGHFPRQISEVPAGETLSDEELNLYEGIVYWESLRNDFRDKINELRASTPQH